jgi:hypothetical protein
MDDSSGFGQAAGRARRPPLQPLPQQAARRGAGGRPPARPTAKEIPYDYVAAFDLLGQRGNRIEQVISISVEGAFVVTSIGYSFIPAPLPAGGPGGVINLEAVDELGAADLPGQFLDFLGRLSGDPRMLAQSLLARICGIDFLYSIIDSASGRELQNRSIHNIAGLGDPYGKRPFRAMPKPMLFLPRSTIRVLVEEISEGPIYGYQPAPGQQVTSQLFLVLHGYKILGQVT